MYVVLYVYHGVPASVEGFYSEDAAQRRADELRAEINPEDDEVAVFEVVPQ